MIIENKTFQVGIIIITSESLNVKVYKIRKVVLNIKIIIWLVFCRIILLKTNHINDNTLLL